MRFALALCLAAGCADEHNLGNTVALGQQHWTITLGGADLDQGHVIALDPAGDVIAGGTFRGTIDLGDGPVAHNPAATSIDATWLAKRAGVDGSAIWSHVLGNANGGQVDLDGLAVDASGAVIAVGRYRGREDFGGVTLVANGDTNDGFLAKYDASGVLAWARGIGPASDAEVRSVAISIDGAIYVGGMCRRTVAFVNDARACAIGGTGFIAKYASDGTQHWGHFFPDIVRVVAMPDGGVVALASVGTTSMFGDTLVQPTSEATPVAVRLDAGGTQQWARIYGDPGLVYAGMAATGGPDGTVLTVSNSIAYADASSVASLDGTGARMWQTLTPTGDIRFAGIAPLPEGATITGGSIHDYTADVGGGPLTGTMFLSAYTATGAFADARAFGNPGRGGDDAILAIAATGTGAIAFVGYVDAAVDFGTGPVQFAGQTDIVIGMIDAP